mgnify:FL=1
MTRLQIAVLVGIACRLALQLASVVLAHRAELEPPSRLKGWGLSSEVWRRSRAHTLETLYPKWIGRLLTLGGLIWLWLSGTADSFALWASSLNHGSIYFGSTVYFTCLVLGSRVIQLPFAAWTSFHVEPRYRPVPNPAKQRINLLFGHLVLDLAKVFCLSAVLAVMMANRGMPFFVPPVLVAAFLVLYSIGTASRSMKKAFGGARRLDSMPVWLSIQSVAKSAQLSVSNVHVLAASKSQSVVNAMMVGSGENREVLLFDNLIRKFTPEQVAAVVAHEFGHAEGEHLRWMGLVRFAVLATVYSIAGWCISNPSFCTEMGFMSSSPLVALLGAYILILPIDTFLLGPILFGLSRRNEWAADRFAAERCGVAEDLAQALIGISEHNLSQVASHPFNVFFAGTHPSTEERVTRLFAQANASPS